MGHNETSTMGEIYNFESLQQRNSVSSNKQPNDAV